MSISTHPSPGLMASFATGQLAVAAGVVVAAHLEACSICRQRIRVLEEAEGQLLDEMPDAVMTDAALEGLLKRLDAEAAAPRRSRVEAAARLSDVQLPSAVARLGVGSRRWLAPGLWTAPVRAPATEGWRAFLLRAPPGTRIPRHGHDGGEMIAVIAGAFVDGERYEPGDFAETRGPGDHELSVTDDGPCACLVATEGRMQWRGWSKVIGRALDI